MCKQLIILEKKRTKLLERVEKEKGKAMDKYRRWLNGGKGFRSYRTPDFDSKVDTLRDQLAELDIKILNLKIVNI